MTTKVVTVHGISFEMYNVIGNGWTTGPVLDIRKRIEEKFQRNKLSPMQVRALDILPDAPSDCFMTGGALSGRDRRE